jgi:uncharacterized protein YebE (UPF0316 family)
MSEIMISNVWMNAALIFVLRVINMALDTLRIRMMARGKKGLAFVFGVVETLIFVYTLSSVFEDIDNWINTLAYAFGFATGSVVGMWLEERMAVGYIHLRVISPNHGLELAHTLRDRGFAVTEYEGRGRDGAVVILSLSVKRKNANKVRAIVEQEDENAFITSEDLQPVRRGFWGIR